MDATDNDLAAVDLIIEILRNEMPELEYVGGAESLHEIESRTVLTPAVLVLFDNEELKQSPGYVADEGGVQLAVQKIHLELVVTNHEDMVTGDGLRQEAGVLRAKVRKLLSGRTLGPGFDPLIRTNSPKALHEPGRSYYPLTFTTTVVYQ